MPEASEVLTQVDQAVEIVERYVKQVTADDTLKGMKIGHVWRALEKARVRLHEELEHLNLASAGTPRV